MDSLQLWLIILLPLVGFSLNGLVGKRMPHGVVSIVGMLAILGSFGLTAMAWSQLNSGESSSLLVTSLEWFTIGDLTVDFELLIDPLSVLWMLIITGVGSLIHLYSIGYMGHDARYAHYMAYLNLFVAFMLILVMGGNYLLMFIGWEGVGLCSYLLIGFWFKNMDYSKAARKAFVMNRIGDLGLLIGLFILVQQLGTLRYTEVFPAAMERFAKGDGLITLATFCLFIGAMGKSAQIPLYTWLPDAMAGPTPVSALIHAATMVTAGIYMVVRSNVLFLLAPQTLEFIAIIGAATALFAATIGVAQNDIKKVLAYSTVSQLGYMFLALGVGAFSSSVFHVATHAFFKALLFLGAGSVIHAMSNEQNMAFMGGLRGKLPITFITMLVGTIAIAGIPPFSGFFSKDEILAHAFEHNIALWAVGLIAAGFTSFYMFRLLFLTFFGEFRGTEDQRHHLHESPATMTIPLIVLAILAAVGGMMSLQEVFGFESALSVWLKPVLAPGMELAGESHHLDHNTEYLLMGISVAVALAGAAIASALYLKPKTAEEVNKTPQGVMSLWANKYYIDEAYDILFVKPTLAASRFYHDFVERWVIDGAVRLIGSAPWATGQGIKFSQPGAIAFYVAAMVVGVLLLFTYQLLLFTL